MNLRFSISILAIVSLVFLAGCSRIYEFGGMVVDGDGLPIEDALIYVYPQGSVQEQRGADASSDFSGKFEAYWGSAVGVDYFRMVISKAGYRMQERLVEPDGKDLRIVMERRLESAKPISNAPEVKSRASYGLSSEASVFAH